MRPMRAEYELLLASATSRVDALRAARIAALCGERLSWDVVLPLAERHAVLPLLSRSLADIGYSNVPTPVAVALRQAFRANATWSLRQAGVLVEMMTGLDAAGVEATTWKGPALALAAYGHVGLRTFSDLDLLVHQDDVDRAAGVLTGLGLRAAMSLPAEREWIFVRDDVVLELHLAPAPRVAPGLNLTTLRSEPLKIGATAVRHLAAADLLVTLCVHAGKHRWSRLQWIADVTELLRSHPDLDWHRVRHLSKSSGSVRAVHLGVRLARDALSAPLPALVDRAIDADTTAARLARDMTAALFEPARSIRGLERLRLLSFQLRMRERVRDKLRYACGGVEARVRRSDRRWATRT
jgi:hypothetical protein